MQKMCEVTRFSFKNYENNSTIVKVMMKNRVAPFYLRHASSTLYDECDKRSK